MMPNMEGLCECGASTLCSNIFRMLKSEHEGHNHQEAMRHNLYEAHPVLRQWKSIHGLSHQGGICRECAEMIDSQVPKHLYLRSFHYTSKRLFRHISLK